MTRELLKPSCHLTTVCWSSFSKYVRTHPGWSVKRRVASEQEKLVHKETRKGKVYFVLVTFTPHKKAQKKIRKTPLASKDKNGGEPKDPPAIAVASSKSASSKRAREGQNEFNEEVLSSALELQLLSYLVSGLRWRHTSAGTRGRWHLARLRHIQA